MLALDSTEAFQIQQPMFRRELSHVKRRSLACCWTFSLRRVAGTGGAQSRPLEQHMLPRRHRQNRPVWSVSFELRRTSSQGSPLVVLAGLDVQSRAESSVARGCLVKFCSSSASRGLLFIFSKSWPVLIPERKSVPANPNAFLLAYNSTTLVDHCCTSGRLARARRL